MLRFAVGPLAADARLVAQATYPHSGSPANSSTLSSTQKKRIPQVLMQH